VKAGNVLPKILVTLAILVGAGIALRLGLRDTVTVTEVRRGRAVDAVPGSIEVFADKDLQALRIEGGGRVADCRALDEGHAFKEGDILLQLDVSEIERGFAAKTREYSDAKERSELQRKRNSERVAAEKVLADARRFHELGVVSAEDVKAAERRLDAVLTSLDLNDLSMRKMEEDYKVAREEHELQLKKMRVRAPSDGMIKGVMVAPDALVAPGATVATFYANDRVVIARISEEDFAKVRLGCNARVQLLSFAGEHFNAKVTKILPFADPDTRRYTLHLKVEAPMEKLLPNSTGEVTITVGEHDNVPLIPRQALFNGTWVFVVRDGRLEKCEVNLGFKALNFAEVVKGLQPGDSVVLDNQDLLRDGQSVRVRSRD
jgi:RND family efflux transporter MFP subunit